MPGRGLGRAVGGELVGSVHGLARGVMHGAAEARWRERERARLRVADVRRMRVNLLSFFVSHNLEMTTYGQYI